MWDEVGKAMLAFVSALVVAFVASRLQQGSRRRRVHRELVEILDILQRMDDLHSDVETRLRTRSRELVRQYSPEPRLPRTAEVLGVDREQIALATVLVIVAALSIWSGEVRGPLAWIGVTFAAASTVILVRGAVLWLLDRRPSGR